MDDLTQLRVAAEQRQWTTLQDTFKRLITELEPLIALQIVAPYVRRFLPAFESYYPDAGWVRELLLTVVSYASAPNELPEHTLNKFPNPGCGNFLMAVFDLARTVQPKYTVYERYSHITNALSNAILAELQHLYYREHDHDFTVLISPSTPKEERARINYEFWLDKKVARLDTARWLQVAKEVEEKLAER